MRITNRRWIGWLVASLCLGISLLGVQAQRPQPGTPKPFQLPAIEEKTLANGLKVYFLPDHRSTAIWMRLVLRAGQIYEPSVKPGLSGFVAQVLTKGTQKRGAEELAETIEKVGGSLTASSDKDLLTITANVRKENAALGAMLIAEVATQPAFKPDEIEVVRTQTLNALQDAFVQPSFVADSTFNRVLFGDHPYGAPDSGTPQSIAEMKREDLQAFHQELFAPNNAALYLAGDLTPKEAFDLAEKHFGSWQAQRIDADTRRVRSSQGQIVLIDRPGSTQTEIRIGTTTPPYGDPIRIPAYVMNKVLGGGGFLNRLVQVVRVEKGLVYDIYSQWEPFERSGRFVIQTATKTESTREAIDLILKEVQRIRTESIPPGELKEQKDFLIGSRGLAWESTPRLLDALIYATHFGDGVEQLRQFTQRVAAVTAEDVQKAAQELSDEKRIIVLVGDASKIESSLQGLGNIRKIALSELDLNSSQLVAVKMKPVGTPEDARAFLQKAVQVHGGEKLTQIQNLVGKGKGAIYDPEGFGEIAVPEMTFYLTADGKSRLDMESAFGLVSQISDGEHLWFVFGGNAQDAPAGFAVPSLLALARASISKDYKLQMYEVTEWEGKKLQPLSVKDSQGREFIAYFDPGTHRLVRATARGGMGPMEFRFDNFQPQEGLTVPYKLEVFMGGELFMRMESQQLEIDQKLDPALFRKPAD